MPESKNFVANKHDVFKKGIAMSNNLNPTASKHNEDNYLTQDAYQSSLIAHDEDVLAQDVNSACINLLGISYDELISESLAFQSRIVGGDLAEIYNSSLLDGLPDDDYELNHLYNTLLQKQNQRISQRLPLDDLAHSKEPVHPMFIRVASLVKIKRSRLMQLEMLLERNFTARVVASFLNQNTASHDYHAESQSKEQDREAHDINVCNESEAQSPLGAIGQMIATLQAKHENMAEEVINIESLELDKLIDQNKIYPNSLGLKDCGNLMGGDCDFTFSSYTASPKSQVMVANMNLTQRSKQVCQQQPDLFKSSMGGGELLHDNAPLIKEHVTANNIQNKATNNIPNNMAMPKGPVVSLNANSNNIAVNQSLDSGAIRANIKQVSDPDPERAKRLKEPVSAFSVLLKTIQEHTGIDVDSVNIDPFEIYEIRRQEAREVAGEIKQRQETFYRQFMANMRQEANVNPECTFDRLYKDELNHDAFSMAFKFLASINQKLNKQMLLVFGDRGSGKTMLCNAIANQYMSLKAAAHYHAPRHRQLPLTLLVNFDDIKKTWLFLHKETFEEKQSRENLFKTYCDVDLLILDGLCSDNMALEPFSQKVFSELIRARVAQNLPMVITTSINLQAIHKAVGDLCYEGIKSFDVDATALLGGSRRPNIRFNGGYLP